MRLLIILILFFLVFSCKKKDENYIISGKVINKELNTPISQVSLVLYGTKISSGVVQNQQEKLATAITSIDGTFSLKFKKQVFSTLKIVLTKEGCFNQEKLINPESLNPGDEYYVNIDMHSLSWLKTIIKNVGNQSVNDQLYYKLNLPYNNCNTCCITNQRVFDGTGVDTTWFCPVYGGSYAYILWVYSNGQYSNPHNDTLFIPAGDTVLHPIFY